MATILFPATANLVPDLGQIVVVAIAVITLVVMALLGLRALSAQRR